MRSLCSPVTEAARKSVLDGLEILDTLPEAFSEAIASAAAAVAGVPIAALSLVDTNRQWFKAAYGLNVSETPRDVSFCSHAIAEASALIVPDALSDIRFSNNALVTGAPFVRFYAGFPLLVEGFAVGALCVIDTRPRELSTEAVEKLKALAAGASGWLETGGASTDL